MPDRPAPLTKRALDKDLDKITFVEDASDHVSRRLVAPGFGLIFLGLAMLFAGIYVLDRPDAALAITAAALAAYMAMNIGAKDVANNVGAAVGARAITMGQALVMAALLSAAIWINLATWLKAPVSTTHAIVGAVMGAGLAAFGPHLVNWRLMIAISTGWVVTPVLGGAIAAALLFFINTFIVYRDDKIAAARYWIPILTGVMAGTFAAYLVLQTAPAGWFSGVSTIPIGIMCGLATWLLARPLVIRQSEGLENKNSALRKLFRLPLIGAAALMSFAHGANDVANAIGPLTAIVQAAEQHIALPRGNAPFWVVLIGACGISVGILLYGPRLIRLIGEQITKLNPMRAYCVSLSAALTVIVAARLGLPVSSTHIAVGAVFGVGFFREWYSRHSKQRMNYMRMRAEQWDIEEPEERNPDEARRRLLVRRSHFMTIIAAWIVTVPASATLAALTYWVMVALFV